MTESLKTISELCEYILHPTKIFLNVWNWTVDVSFWIFLIIALFSLVNYVLGIKKFAKYVPWCIGIYAFIQALGKI